MRYDFGYFEEDKLGKPYDIKLLMRLFPFARPYGMFLMLSVLLVVCITLLDLAIPYVTKIAIDQYIVPGIENKQKTGTASDTGKDSTPERYYEVDLGDPDAAAVVKRYEHLFQVSQDTARISYKNLSQLDKQALSVIREPDLAGVAMVTGAFLGIVLINLVFNFFQVLVMEYTGQMIMHDLRMTLFKHIQDRSLSFYTRNPVGRLVTRVTNDVQNMHELFTSVITFVFKDLFLLAGIAIVLLSLNWKLALISFSVIPLVVVGSLHFSRKARDAFRILRIKVAEINTKFNETIGGIRVIQLFLQERQNFRQFRKLNHENYLAGMRQIHVLGVFMPFIELMGVIAVALVIYHGGKGVLTATVSLGSLVAFISYMKMFFRPIRDIADKYNLLQNAMASAERIFLVLDNTEKDAPDATLSSSKRKSDVKQAEIEPSSRIENIREIKFEDVSFGYVKNEKVLHRVSLDIRAGQTVAIVGPTGSGKTTLINMLPRFYEPDSGRILINGEDIRSFPSENLRSAMAIVAQDPFLFSESIERNIFPGDNHFTSEMKERILKASNCDRMIERLPKGLDTVLSEAGASLSSGQRQLISIARAFAKDPSLIILDEATSYIDSETEQKIQEAVGNLMKDRTAIVVAHRLSTARGADNIIVLHRGRIIESGDHARLMEKKGFYHRLNQLQNGEPVHQGTHPGE